MLFNYQIIFTIERRNGEQSIVNFSGKSSRKLSDLIDDCIASVMAMPVIVANDYSKSELIHVSYSPVKNPFGDEKED